jgi:pimeloyl-ACP methyl ester carboxylesterase
MLHTRSIGSGDDVYLALHGWSGSTRTFDPLESLLPDGVRLLAVDLPGSGRSPAPTAWTRRHIDEAIVELLDSIDVPRLHLLGNCSGAILGLSAGRLRPGRFDRVVIIDPFAYVPWYFKLFLAPVAGPVMYYSAFANPAGRWLTNSGLAKHRADGGDLTDSFSEVNHPATLGTLRVLDEIGVIQSFKNVGNERVVLHGERTFGAVLESLALWKQLWPDAAIVELKGAGHLPIQEVPHSLVNAAFSAHAGGQS